MQKAISPKNNYNYSRALQLLLLFHASIVNSSSSSVDIDKSSSSRLHATCHIPRWFYVQVDHGKEATLTMQSCVDGVSWMRPFLIYQESDRLGKGASEKFHRYMIAWLE